MTDDRPARSITKTVAIDRPWPQVHQYLAAPATGPSGQRAGHRRHRRPRLVADDNPARYRPAAHPRRRSHPLLDHDFRDPQAA